MKLLLINPPTFNIIVGNNPKSINEGRGFLPPLGLMYIAGYILKNTDVEVNILDCEVEQLTYNQIKDRIVQEKPDVVGMTVLTFTLMDVMELAKIIKEINSNIKIVLGGIHANIYPEETIKIKEIDFLVLGEGERFFRDLLNNIDNVKNLYNIKGIVFRDQGKIINTGCQDFIENLDQIPFPARNLTPYKKYQSILAKESIVTTMLTSRGCPYRCLFCDRPHLGKKFRARSAKNVVDEMEECKKMGINEILIYDDTFTIDRQRVLDICSEIKRRNLEIKWDVRARVDTVDKEILQLMKEAGCVRIHYGVEAGTQKILNILRKGFTLETIKETFKITKELGIQTLAYFMIGSPTETIEDIKKTINFAKEIDPDFVNFSITTPFPATDLYLLGLKKGIIKYDYWKEFAENPKANFIPFFWEENLKREELIDLVRKAYKSFYLRPDYIIKKILELRSWDEFKKKVRGMLNIITLNYEIKN